jgi:PKD repeat protein
MKNVLLLCFAAFYVLISSASTAQSAWADFRFPELRFADEDEGSEGSKIFHQLVPDPDEYLRNAILIACRILYRHPAEVPRVERIDYVLKKSDVLSAKGGMFPNIYIHLSTEYVQRYHSQNGSNGKTTLEELEGVLIHELTHAFQHSPQQAGGYVGGTDHFSCVEGVADGVRTKAGFIAYTSRKPGGHWNDGYKTTGFFIDWLTTRDTDFIYKLNQSAVSIVPWSWDKALQSIFGVSTEALWVEYQKAINPNGNKPRAAFVAEKTRVVTGESVVFHDNSTEGPYLWQWVFENGQPASSNTRNPEVLYNTEGTYTVSLSVKNPFGDDRVSQTGYITVGKNPNGILFTVLGGEVKAEHDDSPEGEDPQKAFDGNLRTKFLTFNKSGWVQFASPGEKYKLKQLAIISANDAPERDPVEVVVMGSNGGVKWKTIDTFSGVQFDDRFQTRSFRISTRKYFSMYRIYLTCKQGSVLQVGEIKMFGDPKN